MESIIECKQLTKTYGELTAVNQLSLTIEKGEVFGLLGPNGAGKSTTILMLMGLTEPTSGSASVCGINPTRNPIEVKRKVGYLPDDIGFYEDRSGLDQLLYTAALNRIPKAEAEKRAYSLLERVGLLEAANKKAGKYSRGMRQRLGLADVLMKNPEVIILDEPTLGIDPKGITEFLALISSLSREEGMTVLLSSHHLHQVQQICDRVGLFVKGSLLAAGDIASLSKALFAEDPIQVEASLSSVSNEVIERLQQWEEIKNIEEHRPGEWTFTCVEDITSRLASELIRSGAELTGLKKKQYGLDEIYHRYFSGGEKHGNVSEEDEAYVNDHRADHQMER